MRRLRIQYFILIMLSFLSIISVGFATWVTTNDSALTSDITGIIEVEDVLKSNDYLEVIPESLKYYKTGFVDEKGRITNVGEMKVDITLKLDKCKETFSAYPNLKISLQVLYSDNAFYLINNNDITLIVNVINATRKDNTISNNLCTTGIDVENFQTLSNITITVIYKFTSSMEDFSPVFESLKQSSFIYSARITGIEGN